MQVRLVVDQLIEKVGYSEESQNNVIRIALKVFY